MRWTATCLAVGLVLLGGCRRGDRMDTGYRTLPRDPNRDTDTARRENARALALIEDGKLEEAEKVLNQALEADLFYGPAHNNLGVLYHRKENAYRAAWELQYAIKLMPHCPEPRNNLGLVYETVGRLKEAEAWYDEALSLQPDNPELIGNLVRARLRKGLRDEKTYRLLQELALKAVRPEWARWARDQLAVIQEPRETPVQIPSKSEPERNEAEENRSPPPPKVPGEKGGEGEQGA